MAVNLIITKPNYNALTESNVNNQIFNAQYGTLQYYASGSVDLEVDSADEETSITHDLGYVPFFVAYVNYFASVSSSNFSMTPAIFSDFGAYSMANVYATTNKLYFRVETNTATVTYKFYYKIFRNNLGL